MIRKTRRMTPKRNLDSLGSTRGSRVGFGGSSKHSFLTERNKENEDCSAHELCERTRKLDRQNTSAESDLLLKIQRHLACLADKSLWINPSVTRERILRSTNGECPSFFVDDQGNQNLPEMRRQHLFRRAGRALPRMRVEKCAP